MTRPSSASCVADNDRVALEAADAAEFGGLLAGIAGWIADGHVGWPNMGLHVGMTLNLPGPDGLGDLDAVFRVLDNWVERLNPPSVTVRTTHRRWS
ncbi:MAG: hypothetical protein IPQ14_10695 [Candidatus Microthrix sp.]|uniref:hypothetical protein n=1 Tax=Candidatus Neomicrothrix sp. TaxID=2719034 RepID=UPI0025BD74AF|nr:hypothetical protein [Candidatus Microthrix sp.]MBL0204765.1 hypothetical protein [Candidatus Microthrix sp.]